jgi:hypothetical protein
MTVGFFLMNTSDSLKNEIKTFLLGAAVKIKEMLTREYNSPC